METDKSAYTVQTVNKAFELLGLLSESSTDLTLPVLASKVQLSRNKAYRLLTTLVENGLAEHDKQTGTYRLGIASYSLAQKVIHSSSVINLSHSVIEELARKHDEAVYMTVIRRDEVLFLDMADCDQQIKTVSLLGKQFPYFTNAAGKAIKALESAEVIEWLRSRKLGKYKGITDTEKLATELLEIRSNGGVAVDCGGLGEGISSVAVAVKDYAGHVIGAITMLGPSFRLVKERIENEIIPSLMEGAAAISEKFGYAPV